MVNKFLKPLLCVRINPGLFYFFGHLLLFVAYPAYPQPLTIESIESWMALENLVTGMIQEAEDSLLVLENHSGELSRIRFNDRKEILSIETILSGLTDPIAIIQSTEGDIFTAERSTGRILRYSGDTLQEWTNGFDDISSIRFDKEENIWVSELQPGRIIRIDKQTREQEEILKNLDFPSDLLVTDNTLIFSELVDRPNLQGRITAINLELLESKKNPGKKDRKVIESIINPVRLSPDPINPNYFYISARNESPAISTGAILRLDLELNEEPQPIQNHLFGPTDLIPTPEGIYVIEEQAEKISFIDGENGKTVMWDGLGSPSHFALEITDEPELIVAEQKPQTRLRKLSRQLIQEIPLPENLSITPISGIAIEDTNYYFTDFLSLGSIQKISGSGTAEPFSQEVFAPGRIRTGQDGSLWVLDPIINEIAKLNQSGNILERYSTTPHQFVNFDIQTGEQNIFGLDDQTHKIVQYDSSKSRFTNFLNLPQNQSDFNRCFERVPSKGFFVAQNDENGTLLWIDDTGSDSIISENFTAIQDMIWNHETNRLYVLSQEGWIQSIVVNFNETGPTPTNTPSPILEPSPTPTPTPSPTFEPSPTPTHTPLPTIEPSPTPTPTVLTSVSGWKLH